jgi:hypothetical protein
MSDATPPADVSIKPTQRFRRLRIAVSVFSGVLAVTLCVLWMRGYIDSSSSWFGFDWQSKYYSISWNEGHFGITSVLSKDHGQGNDMIYIGGGHHSRSDFQPVLGFRWLVFDNGWSLLVPSCFPVSVVPNGG